MEYRLKLHCTRLSCAFSPHLLPLLSMSIFHWLHRTLRRVRVHPLLLTYLHVRESDYSNRSPFLFSCTIHPNNDDSGKTADGGTVDVGTRMEDLEARMIICPEGMRFLYPLGNGAGGLLSRRRWRGGRPKLQQVQHIGKCRPQDGFFRRRFAVNREPPVRAEVRFRSV